MNYCSTTDITAVIANADLVQLTNDSGGDTVDTDKITDAINYVSNVINGYLRGRYNLPLVSIPEELKFLAIDFVVYRLYSRRMYTEIPDTINEKYKNVVKILEQTQKGTFNLGVETSNAYNNPTLKTNKTNLFSSVNKQYDSKKWDKYSS